MKKLAYEIFDGRRCFRLILATVGLSVFCACVSGGNYGLLQPSQEVSDMFVKGPLSSDYNYYYSGALNKPRAILGLEKKYTLETQRWKPVDAAGGQIRTMVDTLTGERGFALANFGSVVLDPQGNRIGVWYSKNSFSTTIKMMGDNVVSIYPPDRGARGPRAKE